MKNILVTGAHGFLGKNLIEQLRKQFDDLNILLFDVKDSVDKLHDYLNIADFVFHLAGSNRPKDISEFEKVNTCLTRQIIDYLLHINRHVPVALSSSTQAILDNPYGKSKQKAELALIDYAQKTGTPVYLFRFTNIFGRMARPDYNSAVATFCYHIGRDETVQVNDPKKELQLIYVDEAVKSLISCLDDSAVRVDDYYCEQGNISKIILGDLVRLIRHFRAYEEGNIPLQIDNKLAQQLYDTYCSYK